MWKDYSADYIRNNCSSSLSVRLSAFISALLLSLLCGLFYNTWKYEVERIELKEGGWQSRITGELAREDIEAIRNYANVKEAAVNERENGETVTDIYFHDYGTVFSDMPRIAELTGISQERVAYNYELLAVYLIRGEGDSAPRLVFPMFILITALALFSLIVLLHNSFAVSMNARVRQFGIFSSIGATPKQIRTCLVQEAAALCAALITAGNLLGIAGSIGVSLLSNILLGDSIPGRHKAVPGYHPLILALSLVITVLTVWISAWLPAVKLSRLTPLEAMKNAEELKLKRGRKSPALVFLFGAEGELAGSALKAQRKALRTASLALVFSFMAFTIMQCFFALSGISTRETYFEKYQDVWDIMVTVKDIEADDFEEAEAVRSLPGVKSAIVYQKAAAKRVVTEGEMSEDMKSLGGFSHAQGQYVAEAGGGWLINAPVVILADNSFLAYCEEIGAAPRLDGAVIWNQIRDVTNPDFRHPDFMPYVKGESAVSVLRRQGHEKVTAEIPVLAYTEEVPALREEYATLDYYEMVHFVPASLWKEIKGQIGGEEEDTCICVRGKENVTSGELNAMQDGIYRLLGGKYTIECENRIREYEINGRQIQGLKAVFGGFCILLAVIGVGNVFSNTLGFVRQRKREFARYMSIGMTPGEICRMFCIEASVLAVRPFLIGLLPTCAAVGYMLKLSYVGAEEFLAETPFIPIVIFILSVWGSVALAYFLSWRNMRRVSLAEVLRDDTMM